MTLRIIVTIIIIIIITIIIIIITITIIVKNNNDIQTFVVQKVPFWNRKSIQKYKAFNSENE